MKSIDAAGKYDFKSNSDYELVADSIETKGIKNAKNFLGEKKVNLKDGIDAKEAEYIITELQDDDIIGDDDTNITDKELKKFLKKRGEKTNKNTLASVKGIIKKITNVWGNTKDSKIQSTEQGALVGDCWLLSSVNGLNYTDEGKKIIKDALEYQKDGTTVHFKGVGDIFVSNEDLQKAKTISQYRYSRGDDDMKIFEIATEQVREKIYNGDIVLSDDMPSAIKYTIKEENENSWGMTLDAGQQLEMLYYLTGKTGKSSGGSEDKKIELLNNFIQNENKDYVLYAGKSKDETIKDIDGNKVKLKGPHAYAVKSADEETVTITNPHDESVEIKLSRASFLKTFDSVAGCDLSDDNPTQDYVIKTKSKTIKNNDGTKTKIIKDSDGKKLQELTFKDDKITYKKEYKTLKENDVEIKSTIEKKYNTKGQVKSEVRNWKNKTNGEYGTEKTKYTYKKDKIEENTNMQIHNKNDVLVYKSTENPNGRKSYKYNDDGKIIKKEECKYSDDKITKLTVTNYEYDEKKQLETECKRITNNKTGEYTEITTKYKDGKKISTTTSKYDRCGGNLLDESVKEY